MISCDQFTNNGTFIETFLANSHTSRAIIFMYFRYKCIVAKLIAVHTSDYKFDYSFPSISLNIHHIKNRFE